MSIPRTPEDSRLTTFPLARPAMFAFYQDATRMYWTVEEISLKEDANHYVYKLTADERFFVDHILAFFAASDGLVNINLAKRFKKDVGIIEASYFYDYQTMMENVHANTYSLLLDSIIPTKERRDQLLNAIKTIPIITELSDYITGCINSTEPFAERLLKMACVEGLLFTGCFYAIYWLQNRGLMPGLAHSNELIAKDEALHTIFALYLYTLVDVKPTREAIEKIFREAVDLAKKFIGVALPNGMLEINSESMGEYIENQADNLLVLIDQAPLYGTIHESHFMVQQNLVNRTNFFERRPSEYARRERAATEAYGIDYDV